ncbi:MAG: glycosyltransferase [Methanosphaera sp.]|nr:glycosyltransferase [Methanosphaera sp.]
MNNDMLIRLLEEFNSNNILLTSSKNTIDDDLLNYFTNYQKKVTIINEKMDNITAKNIIIKNTPLSDQLPLEKDFDIVILQDFNLPLKKQIEIFDNFFNYFPLTVLYYENWGSLDSLITELNSYKLNNDFSLSIKILDSNAKIILLYVYDEKLNDKIESFLINNSDLSHFGLNDTSEQFIELSENIRRMRKDILEIKEENSDKNKLFGSIDDYKGDGIISGWIMGFNSENNKIRIIIDNQKFSLGVNSNTSEKEVNTFIFSVPEQFIDNDVHNIILMDEISNRIISERNMLLNNEKKELTVINDYSDNILKNQYETQYFSNIHKSLFDRIRSKLYPFSLLLHRHKVGGLKNALITIKAYPLLKLHDVFDVGYYIQQKPEILYGGVDVYLHYIYHGSNEGLKPSKNFDGVEYLKLNPDLKNIKLNPLIHYLLYGKAENRFINQDEQEGNPVVLASNNSNIKGAFQSFFSDSVLEGWVAELGNNKPLKAKVLIDNQVIEITADIYRPDLKQNGINEGRHGFKVVVPEKFIDGFEHTIQLTTLDDEVVTTIKHTWEKPNYENTIQRFLAFSMTSPVISLPLSEAEKKILAVMENIANYLCTQIPEDKPLVSVIMPVYNRSDLVSNAIKSVLNQSYDNFELIIIDDGSTDDTINQINKFKDKRIKLLKNEENRGVSYSRNRGLKESKGRYITYLDSDNDWDERYVEAVVGAFTVNKDADAVYSGQLIYKRTRYNLDSIRFGAFNKGLLSNNNYIDLNAYAHTRELYEKADGFDENLERFVDWDLILKYSLFGKTYSIPVVLSNYYYYVADNAISDDVTLADTIEIIPEKHKQRLEKINYNLKLNKGVSVIIPSYESLNDLKECLNSLFEFKSELLEIIVVDNNSSENVKNYLKYLESKNKIKLILNDTNFGFTYAVNQGIELSKKDNDILLLNNDAVITENAIEILQHEAYMLDKCAMTVPQQILPPKTNTINVHVPYATENNEIDVNLSHYHKNIINLPLYHNGEYTELSFAPFFCVYIKREIYDKSLGLDAELGRHYRSDMIFCNYVREIMGYKIYHVSNSRVYHKLQKSTQELEEKSVGEHDLLFKQNRWSKKEQEKYGFKQARWDVDKKQFVEPEIIIKEYTLTQIEEMENALNNHKTIIIPIYNAFDETKKCINSVLEYTEGNYELLLINDCSIDSRVKTYLDEIKGKYPQIKVIHNQTNKGFVATVNVGFENSIGDVIILNSDTIVTKNWLRKLTISAYQSGEIGTVTPVSNNAGAFSVPNRSKSNPILNNLTINQMAQIVEENSNKTVIETPTGNGFCMYIKRDVITEVGNFDENTFGKGYGEENDFCMRALEKGWKHIVDDSVYIYHKGSTSFKEESKELLSSHLKILESKYPTYMEEVHQFLKSGVFNNSCTKLQNTISSMAENKRYKKILFVLHEGIGGSIYFTNDLISKISKYYDCYVLLSSGSQITLKQWKNGLFKRLKTWSTNGQWHVDYYYMETFKEIYFNVLTSLNVDLIHIQHLVKHSYDLFDLIKELKIPYVINLHDYYYICPSLNLLNDQNQYCEGKCNSTNQCDLPIPALNNAPVINQMQDSWRKINKELLGNAEKLIVPTNYVKKVYSDVYPNISSKIDIIAHGQDLLENKQLLSKCPSHNEKIRVVIPGNIGISKGALLFKQIKMYDINSQIEFHFLGVTHESITENEGILHGTYEREDYAKIIKEIKPSLTGIFSLWPETFSYTLNESWNLNIPVIATNIGALNERIEDRKTGWLVDLDAKKIYDKIIEISNNKIEYDSVVNNIKNIKTKTLKEMMQDYEKIYQQLLNE